MARRLSAVAFSVLLLVLVTTPSLGWKFASIADTQGNNNGVNTEILSKIINHINAENVDFVIVAGDAVTGECDDACLRSQMQHWVSVMSNLNCPFYLSPGNHDIGNATAEDVLRDVLNQPMNGPPGHKEMVYSFDHENAHIVSLNSNHYGEEHRVQKDWLAADLAATTKPHVFVMAHEPAYPVGPYGSSSLQMYPAERDDFWRILIENDVSIYFCGHEHLFHRSVHNGVLQVINGGAGGSLVYDIPGSIAQHHFVVVEVDGYEVQCTVKSDDGVVLDTWSYSTAPPIPISSAKELPDGTPVTLKSKVVTAGTNQLSSTFYLEDADRSSGIRAYGQGMVAEYGKLVHVTGTITTVGGERSINCMSVVTRLAGTVPKPLAMPTREVGGGALNDATPGIPSALGVHNTGLLVQVWGRVTSADTITRNFYIDDGCGVRTGDQRGLWISCGGLAAGNTVVLPPVDSFVKVTGISSRRLLAGSPVPVVRVRTQSDIVIY